MTELTRRLNALDACFKAFTYPKNMRQRILNGVRFVNMVCGNTANTHQNIIDRTSIGMFIGDHIKQLTPRQFTHIFPIDKWYKGEKQGLKDYFSTMEALRAHGMDEPIGEAVYEILLDYANMETREFLVHMTSMLDYINLSEGKPSFLEEFLLGGDAEPEAEEPQHLKLVGGGKRGGYE